MEYHHNGFGIPITKVVSFKGDKEGVSIMITPSDNFQETLCNIREIMYYLRELYPDTIQPSYIVMKAKRDGIITEEEFSLISKYYWYI